MGELVALSMNREKLKKRFSLSMPRSKIEKVITILIIVIKAEINQGREK